MRRLAIILLLALTTGTLPRAQQPRDQPPEPTFRAAVTRVEVTALVVDGKGTPVPGLEAGDFEVFEDGVAQAIRSFSPVTSRPGGIALAEPIGAVSERGPTIAAPVSNGHMSESRIFVLLLDALHVDARRSRVARQAAHRLVERLDPSDLLLVVVTGSGESSGTFSRDRSRALGVIDGFRGQRIHDMTMQRLLTTTPDDPLRAEHYRRFCETLGGVATALRDVPGRSKTLVLISEGSSYGASIESLVSRLPGRVDDAPGFSTGVNTMTYALTSMNDALNAAAAANVVIHPLDPLGLDIAGGDLIEVVGSNVPLSEAQQRSIENEARQSREMLRDLATWTGGIAAVSQNDALGAIDRTLEGAGTHYVLTYESSSTSTRRDYRRIEVKVKRPGLRVLARRGYRPAEPRATGLASTDDSLPPPMRALLPPILPSDGLTMRAQAVAVATTGGQTTYAIVVETEGAGLAAADDGAYRLEQGLLTVDAQGRAGNGMRRAMDFRVSPEQQEAFSTTAVRSVWASPCRADIIRCASPRSTRRRGGAVPSTSTSMRPRARWRRTWSWRPRRV